MTEVTFEGEPVGGATVDVWQDAAGTPCWSARMLMPLGDIASVGHLAGRTRDGRILSGRVSLVGPGPAVQSRLVRLMEWRGVGALQAAERTDAD